MSVLVEALSVIIQASRIEARYTGGVKDFAHFCRRINNTFCTDGELVRVAFTSPEDMKSFVEKLGLAGLAAHRDGKAADFVVADQREGFERSCAWAELGDAAPPGATSGERVASARLVGGAAGKLAVPEGWKYKSSISAREAANAKRAAPPHDMPPFAVFAQKPGDAASLAMAWRRKKQ